MTVTATYVNTNAKVTVAVASAPANASAVLLERSKDQVTWSTVRGATALLLTAGAAGIDDYEFADGVPNYYRATYLDTSTPALVGTPAAATVTTSAGASASATPTMPTGLSVGDVVLVALACTKSTGVVPAAPTGWVALAAATPDCVALYATDWTASLVLPAFTVTGLAIGDQVIAKAFSYRNVAPSAANVQVAVNGSAANIAFPAFTSLGGIASGPLLAFQRSTHTSVSPVANYDDHNTGYALMVYAIAPANYAAGSITVTGGSAATSSIIQANMTARAFVSQETSAAVTPALTTVWIKNPLQPYLNRAVVVIGIDTVTNPARTGVFDIIGRNTPVAVTDVLGSRKTGLTIRMPDPITFQDQHDCLMTGQTQFVHAPNGARTPTGYFALGDLGETFPSSTGTSRYLAFSLTEVAAPAPTLAPTLSTWQTVVSTYATWQALMTAKPTWADVLALVGSPTDTLTG